MRHLTQYIPRSFLSFDGAKIYYEVSGSSASAPVLLFLHGLGGDLTAWDKEREYFTKLGYRTIGMDLRGHGLSERGNTVEFYDMVNFAKDIRSLISQEKLNRFIIIGHCFGGIVSMVLQGKYYTQAKGLILVDTGYKPPHFSEFLADHNLFIKFAGILAEKAPAAGSPGHADYDKFIGTGDYDPKRIYSDIVHTTLRSYLLAGTSVLGFDGTELLKRIKIPALIIEGEKDSVFPVAMARELHARIKNSELEIIPDANHIIVLNNPGDLSRAIEKFITKLLH